MRFLIHYVAREIYDQPLHPHPASDGGTLRTTRKAKLLTLQQVADALHVWPTILSRLERGLSHDNDFHHRYETWLNCQSPETVQTPHRELARVLACLTVAEEAPGQGGPEAVAQRSQQRPLRPGCRPR